MHVMKNEFLFILCISNTFYYLRNFNISHWFYTYLWIHFNSFIMITFLHIFFCFVFLSLEKKVAKLFFEPITSRLLNFWKMKDPTIYYLITNPIYVRGKICVYSRMCIKNKIISILCDTLFIIGCTFKYLYTYIIFC